MLGAREVYTSKSEHNQCTDSNIRLNLTSLFHCYPTPRSRPFARAVQPGPARAGLPAGRFLPKPLAPLPGPAAGLTAPAAPGPRPGGSGSGHAPALRPGGRRPAHPGPSSAFFAASVETERLPKEKEGCSLTAPLPGKSGHLLPLKGGGRGSVPAPRRTMAPEWAAGAAPREPERHRAPPSPAPGSCGRAACGPSHAEGRKGAAPRVRPSSPAGSCTSRFPAARPYPVRG